MERRHGTPLQWLSPNVTPKAFKARKTAESKSAQKAAPVRVSGWPSPGTSNTKSSSFSGSKSLSSNSSRTSRSHGFLVKDDSTQRMTPTQAETSRETALLARGLGCYDRVSPRPAASTSQTLSSPETPSRMHIGNPRA